VINWLKKKTVPSSFAYEEVTTGDGRKIQTHKKRKKNTRSHQGLTWKEGKGVLFWKGFPKKRRKKETA